MSVHSILKDFDEKWGLYGASVKLGGPSLHRHRRHQIAPNGVGVSHLRQQAQVLETKHLAFGVSVSIKSILKFMNSLPLDYHRRIRV